MGRILDEDVVLKEIGRWVGYLDEDMIERIKIGIKKLPEAQQWILCNQKMPEEHEWMGTKQFGTTISDEVYVTFETPKRERFVEHIHFQNGGLSNFDKHTIDAFYKGSVPVAWMEKPKPWKGEQDG